MKSLPFYLVFSVILFIACSEDQDVMGDPMYETGKNIYTIDVDGDEREYYVHVPESYTGEEEVPVVFMLHGSSGNGLKFYNISGWKEVGEQENILTVFPSSWHYCIIDEGQQKNTTKWTTYDPKSWEVCPGEVPRDDIKFLGAIVEEMQTKFSVDERRMYLAGFSNGGQMAFRVAVEMSDVFAAITENSGTHTHDTIFNVKRNLPILLQFGNSEDGINGSEDGTIPMNEFEELLEENEGMVNNIRTHVHSFHLDSNYTLSGDLNKFVTARFQAADPGSEHEFLLRMVKGLEHQYPNGTNHPMKAAETQWAWMQQFQLPE